LGLPGYSWLTTTVLLFLHPRLFPGENHWDWWKACPRVPTNIVSENFPPSAPSPHIPDPPSTHACLSYPTSFLLGPLSLSLCKTQFASWWRWIIRTLQHE
jgi:hypothetical protein